MNAIRIKDGDIYRDAGGQQLLPEVSAPFEVLDGDWIVLGSDALFVPPLRGREYAPDLAIDNGRIAAVLQSCETPGEALAALQELVAERRALGAKDDNLTILVFRARLAPGGR